MKSISILIDIDFLQGVKTGILIGVESSQIEL